MIIPSVAVCLSISLSVCLSLSFLFLVVPFGVYNLTFVCCFLERPREKRRTIILYCTKIHFTAHYNLLRFIVKILEFSRCDTARKRRGDYSEAGGKHRDTDDETLRRLKTIFRLSLLRISSGIKCMVYGYDNIDVFLERNRLTFVIFHSAPGYKSDEFMN